MMLKKTSMPSSRYTAGKAILKIIKYVIFWGLLLVCTWQYAYITAKDLHKSPVNKTALGEELIMAMYNFETPYQLDSQMLIVQTLTTSDVFNDLTIDNEQRTITTYLKFKDCGVSAEIISSGDDYVYYRLNSDVIEENRTFIMFFRVNEDGLIDWVKEAECVEFIDTIY